MTKGHKPGGGIASKNKVSVGNRTGAPRERIRPTGTAQYGQAQGNHFTEQGRDGRMSSDYGGVKAHTNMPGYPSELGNKVALNVGGGGPGTGRTIYKSGSQCKTGDGGDRAEAAPRFGDVMSKRG
jgi:hypothetical protein